MIEGAGDPLLPAGHHERYNATVVRRQDDTPDLTRFWLDIGPGPIDFVPGQYVTVGLAVGDRFIQRPYSIATPPAWVSSLGYEIYVRHVPEGALTGALWQVGVGHRVFVSSPKGRFRLADRPATQRLFVATGTGISPFIAMIRSELETGVVPTVLVHGVRYADELGYKDEIESWQASGAPVTYLPAVSRPNELRNARWAGRFGRAEMVLRAVWQDLPLVPADTQAYLCGHLGMVDAVREFLVNENVSPGSIWQELYPRVERRGAVE